MINYLGYLVIQAVGSLTLKTLGTLRNVGLVVYSVLVSLLPTANNGLLCHMGLYWFEFEI